MTDSMDSELAAFFAPPSAAEAPLDAHTMTEGSLTIGIYHAHAYRYPDETTWRFWVRLELADESEVAKGAGAPTRDAAQAAAEAETGADHAAHQSTCTDDDEHEVSI